MTDIIKYFPALAIFGVMATFWQQSKNVLSYLFHIFLKKRTIPNDIAFQFYKEIFENSKRIVFDNYDLTSDRLRIKNQDFFHTYYVKQYTKELFLYKNFVPIFVSGTYNGINIYYFQFTFNFNHFFTKFLNKYHIQEKEFASSLQSNRGRFYIKDIIGHSNGHSSEVLNNKNNNNSSNSPDSNKNTKYYTMPYYFCAKIKVQNLLGNFNIEKYDSFGSVKPSNDKYQFNSQGHNLLNIVKKWLNSEQWYLDRNIVYKRGCLLYGKPGTGKSSLILEIAKNTGLPLYRIHLSSFDCDKNLEMALENELDYNAGIILFEDIDTIFNGRNNIQKTDLHKGISFDYFINKLSGVNPIKNKFIFFTTNHIENLDNALVRDGRIDEKIELLPLNNEEKYKMAFSILGENNINILNELVKQGINDSNAEFENRCVKYTLNNYWSQ